MDNIQIVTLVIIAITALVSFKGFSDRAFFNTYKFQIGPIEAGEKIRMFTSGFLHVNTTHLFFNMFTLYMFANVVIMGLQVYGFLFVYIASLLTGSLLSLYFHKNEYNYSAVGASGAVTGVLYAAILLRPDMNLYLFFLPIPIPAYIFGIGYLLYSIYGMKNSIGNIGHDAHIGGAIGGYVVTLLLQPELLKTNILMVVLLALPILLLFVLRQLGKL